MDVLIWNVQGHSCDVEYLISEEYFLKMTIICFRSAILISLLTKHHGLTEMGVTEENIKSRSNMDVNVYFHTFC